MARMPRAIAMFMGRAGASLPTSCSDSSNGRPGRRLNLNWRREARAKAYGSISPLACAGCGAEGQIATVVQPARKTAATKVLAALVDCGGRRVFADYLGRGRQWRNTT